MAGGNRDRDLDAIIAFGSKFEAFCNEIRSIASQLGTDGNNAGSVLQDEISKQNIQAIFMLSMQLKNAVDKGEEPVLELVRRAKNTKSQLEELSGPSR